MKIVLGYFYFSPNKLRHRAPSIIQERCQVGCCSCWAGSEGFPLNSGVLWVHRGEYRGATKLWMDGWFCPEKGRSGSVTTLSWPSSLSPGIFVAMLMGHLLVWCFSNRPWPMLRIYWGVLPFQSKIAMWLTWNGFSANSQRLLLYWWCLEWYSCFSLW